MGSAFVRERQDTELSLFLFWGLSSQATEEGQGDYPRDDLTDRCTLASTVGAVARHGWHDTFHARQWVWVSAAEYGDTYQ